MTAVVALNRVT